MPELFGKTGIINTGPPWLPTDIDDCFIWIDSELGITKNESDQIAEAIDQTLTGNNGTQTTDAKKPVWYVNQKNGHAAIRFTAANGTFFYLPNAAMPVQNCTIFCVLKPSAGVLYSRTYNNYGFSIGYHSTKHTYDVTVESPTTSIYRLAMSNAWQIWTAIYNSSQVRSLINGYQERNIAAVLGPIDYGASDDAAMGCARSGESTTWFLNGDVAMLFGYSRELTVPELATAHTALRLKFAINKKWGGGTGTGNGDFASPEGIYIYNDEVFVSDTFNHRVQVFDLNGNYKRKWGTEGTGDGQFQYCTGICVYNDEVYVSDAYNSRIQVFNLTGDFQRKWGEAGSGDGQLNHPSGIFVYGDEVYVAELGNGRIQVFNLAGVYQRKWDYATHGVWVYNDEVYITHGNTIRVTDLNGNLQRVFGETGSGDGQFNTPFQAAIFNEEIYVCDTDNHRVQVFTLSGTFKRKLGSQGVGDNEFDRPIQLFVYSGETTVLEFVNQRVQVVDL